MKLKLSLLACTLCAALALSSCGGDSDSDATASAQVPPEIEQAITAGLAKGEYSAEKPTVVKLEINGDKASAEVELNAGTLAGQTVEAELLRKKKKWTLDGLTKFVVFDKPLLVKNYEIETKELPEELPPALVRCLTETFGKYTQERVEAMYLEQDKSLFTELGKRCIAQTEAGKDSGKAN